MRSCQKKIADGSASCARGLGAASPERRFLSRCCTCGEPLSQRVPVRRRPAFAPDTAVRAVQARITKEEGAPMEPAAVGATITLSHAVDVENLDGGRIEVAEGAFWLVVRRSCV